MIPSAGRSAKEHSTDWYQCKLRICSMWTDPKGVSTEVKFKVYRINKCQRKTKSLLKCFVNLSNFRVEVNFLRNSWEIAILLKSIMLSLTSLRSFCIFLLICFERGDEASLLFAWRFRFHGFKFLHFYWMSFYNEQDWKRKGSSEEGQR